MSARSTYYQLLLRTGAEDDHGAALIRATASLLHAILLWPAALRKTLLHRRELRLVARRARSDENPPVRALAQLLLFAAAGDGVLDEVSRLAMLPRLLPSVSADDESHADTAPADACARV